MQIILSVYCVYNILESSNHELRCKNEKVLDNADGIHYVVYRIASCYKLHK